MALGRPAHIYTYSFEPNPNWSSFYAYSQEIKQYFEDFATKYDLRDVIHLGTKVVSARWIEKKGIYEITVEKAGKLTIDWCHILINGTGILNKWKWPSILGLHNFGGKLLHSANWDDAVQLEGKTVAIIGTGSSSIQIVPQIQPKVKQLVAFMRSVTWISPAWGKDTLEETRAHSQVPSDSPQGQYF